MPLSSARRASLPLLPWEQGFPSWLCVLEGPSRSEVLEEAEREPPFDTEEPGLVGSCPSARTGRHSRGPWALEPWRSVAVSIRLTLPVLYLEPLGFAKKGDRKGLDWTSRISTYEGHPCRDHLHGFYQKLSAELNHGRVAPRSDVTKASSVHSGDHLGYLQRRYHFHTCLILVLAVGANVYNRRDELEKDGQIWWLVLIMLVLSMVFGSVLVTKLENSQWRRNLRKEVAAEERKLMEKKGLSKQELDDAAINMGMQPTNFGQG
eukprot:s813_g17.t1